LAFFDSKLFVFFRGQMSPEFRLGSGELYGDFEFLRFPARGAHDPAFLDLLGRLVNEEQFLPGYNGYAHQQQGAHLTRV
jgi:hypothetical protein